MPHRMKLAEEGSASREIIASANDPAFLLEDLTVLRIVRSNEALELLASQEAVGLGRTLDILLPLGRLAHLLEDIGVECHSLGRNAVRQPYGPRHLELVDQNAGLLAGRNVR